MKRSKINSLLNSKEVNYSVCVKGWVRSFRNNQFIALNDGSCLATLQVVVGLDLLDEATLKQITNGAAISVEGMLVASQGKGQLVEVNAQKIEILGTCDSETYPLQLKNKPSLEYLREHAHLRFRTNVFGAIFRVRHSLAFAIHKFFNEKGFVYLNTPIITASDAEGAGEMFRVTTLPFEQTPKTDAGEINYEEDFFGRSTNLTVSGQLEAELGAMALGEVYTFGPTFRAENSNTTRHLAEFWMIEPEVAFNTLTDNMDLAEDCIQYLINYVLEHNMDDINFLAQRLEEEEKQKKLEELMNKVLDAEMKDLLKEMEEMMDKADKEKLKDLLDKLDKENVDLERELDRELELFKQLEFEQKVEETLDKITELKEQLIKHGYNEDKINKIITE